MFSASVRSTMTGRGLVLVISISNALLDYGTPPELLFNSDTPVIAFEVLKLHDIRFNLLDYPATCFIFVIVA